MFPILFALAILVWMWAAAMRHVVQQVAATATPSQQWVYLAMLVMAGGAALVAILVWFMPGSPLSMGWSQERLVGLKRAAVLTAGATVVLALWRLHLQMSAFKVVIPISKGPTSETGNAKKKRR